jgi:hypothetical protein
LRLRDFRQNYYLRQACPDVVVQIGGDSRPDGFEFGEPLFTRFSQTFFGEFGFGQSRVDFPKIRRAVTVKQ